MLERGEFAGRFRANFYDPAFDGEQAAIARLETIAWQSHHEKRRSASRVRGAP